MGQETIGRASSALLALLDITSQGIGPDKLAREVELGLPGLSFLGESTYKTHENTATWLVTETTATVSTTVPQGLIWLLRGLNVTLALDPTGAAGFTGCIRAQIEDWSPATGSSSGIGGGPPMDIYGAQNPVVYSGASGSLILTGFSYQFDFPLVLRPGQVVRGFLSGGKSSNNGGGIILTLWLNEFAK